MKNEWNSGVDRISMAEPHTGQKEKSISLKNKHFNKSGPFIIQLLCVIDSFLVFSIYTTRYEITGKIEIVTLASNREQLKGNSHWRTALIK